jgi:hypothetical protein
VLLNEQANLKNLNENSCDGIETLAITALPLVIKICTAKGNYNKTVKPSITVKNCNTRPRGVLLSITIKPFMLSAVMLNVVAPFRLQLNDLKKELSFEDKVAVLKLISTKRSTLLIQSLQKGFLALVNHRFVEHLRWT